MTTQNIIAVIPAAGVGRRMGANLPKQYLKILGKTILEHTILKLISVKQISRIVIAASKSDPYIADIIKPYSDVITLVEGGQERADSVLAGLNAIEASENTWVLVHDAARPCVLTADINNLIGQCIKLERGGILASPVADTMKRDDGNLNISKTEQRKGMWHAYTPQMFKLLELKKAISKGLANQAEITDEASAMEYIGKPVLLVESNNCNIKVTRPDDLALAEFFLQKSIESNKE